MFANFRSDKPVTETNQNSNDPLQSPSTSSSSIQCDKEDNPEQTGGKTKVRNHSCKKLSFEMPL